MEVPTYAAREGSPDWPIHHMFWKVSTSKQPDFATRATSVPPSSSTPVKTGIPAPAPRESSTVPESRSRSCWLPTMFAPK